MQSPKVSVGVLSYNHAAYLPVTIESVLAQTYQNLEVIIVDDGSPDNSLAIAREYAVKDGRVKVFTHPNHVNKGTSATCNLVIEKSSGEYIAILGSDDAYYPYTIEEQVKFLDEHADVGIVCGKSQFMDKNGDLLPRILPEKWEDENLIEKMIEYCRISAPTVMVRRICYETVGGYRIGMIWNDWDMWMRILINTKWKVGFIDKLLALYRIHDHNVSIGAGVSTSRTFELTREFYLKLKSDLEKQNLNKEQARYLKLVKTRLAELPVNQAQQHLDNYFSAMESKKQSTARLELKSALSCYPLILCYPRRMAAVLKREIRELIS